MTVLHHVTYGKTNADNGTVVLLGSIGSTTDMWLPQLDALSRDHRVIALDHRGHGGSPVVPGPATIEALASDVLETLDTLHVEDFAVVGLSLGGAVAQYLAATSPRVTRAVFMCTSAKFGTRESWIERAAATRSTGTGALADAVIGRWFSPGFLESKPATTNHYRAMVAGCDDEGYASCCEALANWDFHERLAEISVPVLTIAGGDDPSTPPETLQGIADAVSGEARAEVLSPGAHVPTIERPDEVNALLQEFLGA